MGARREVVAAVAERHRSGTREEIRASNFGAYGRQVIAPLRERV